MGQLPTRRSLPAALMLLTASSCGGEDGGGGSDTSSTGGAPRECVAGELPLSDGSCLAAGMRDNGCPAGESAGAAGDCVPAGVPPDGCGAGFEPDAAAGCVPILPPDACPEGTMAVPGDAACREVASCGDGAWGDIPVDGDTQHVDAGYTGGSSDGSADRPWTSIQQGVDAAAAGAIVAVAGGTYAEGVRITGKPVRLWGRCPELVAVVGDAGAQASILVLDGADGAEVRSLAVAEAPFGIGVSGADVTLDALWIHDTSLAGGLDMQDTLGDTRVTLSNSLIERTRARAANVSGAELNVERTVIRGTLAYQDENAGMAVVLESTSARRARLTVRGSLLSDNRTAGVVLFGADGEIEDTVIRDTAPQLSDADHGMALLAQYDEPGGRASARVASSVFERNHAATIMALGADLEVDATVVRDGQPHENGQLGRGIAVQYWNASERGHAAITRCLVIDNREGGIYAAGADLDIDATVVRGTQPGWQDDYGNGISVEDDPGTGLRGWLALTSSVVEGNHSVGVFVGGSDATIEGTVVRSTSAQRSDGLFGRGMNIQANPSKPEVRASALVRSCVVEDNRDVGIVVTAADVGFEATIIRGTAPRESDGTFGDNLAVFSEFGPSTATIVGSRIESGDRAGLSCFGAVAQLERTRLECNSISLDAEIIGDQQPSLTDAGGNECGCGDEKEVCTVASFGLAPPDPM